MYVHSYFWGDLTFVIEMHIQVVKTSQVTLINNLHRMGSYSHVRIEFPLSYVFKLIPRPY